ncbi:MAG TPA: hypothetical protein VFJ85_16305 [Acidimicrobiales bacterium]|nr:hypothetical protein [Acidimicrobiales bacterium]
MDWGEGTVLAVADAGEGEDAWCDSCARTIKSGLVIDVAATEYGLPSALTVSVCESCFDDLTSDMGVSQTPGTTFLLLVVPAFANRA